MALRCLAARVPLPGAAVLALLLSACGTPTPSSGETRAAPGSAAAQATPVAPGPSTEERRAHQHAAAVALALAQADAAREAATQYEDTRWRRRADVLEDARREALGPLTQRARVLLSAAVALGALSAEEAGLFGSSLDDSADLRPPDEALAAVESVRFALERRLSRPGPIAADVAAATVAVGLPFDVLDGLARVELGRTTAEHPLDAAATAKAAALLEALAGRPALVVAHGASAEAGVEAAQALAARLSELGVASDRLHPLGFELPRGTPAFASLVFLGHGAASTPSSPDGEDQPAPAPQPPKQW